MQKITTQNNKLKTNPKNINKPIETTKNDTIQNLPSETKPSSTTTITKLNTVEELKIRLQQKKNKLAAEETKLKLKERKMLTRNLIELGALIVKANLDLLPTNTLYGALLSLNDLMSKNESIKSSWAVTGENSLNNEKSQKFAVILKFEELQNDIGTVIETKNKIKNTNQNKNSINNYTSKTPELLNPELRQLLKSHGLSWNKFRSEWYGYVVDIQSLKSSLQNYKVNLQVINTN